MGRTVRRQRVALVTGAGRRLGQAIAIALAREGYDLAIHYLTASTGALETARQVEALGREARVYRAELARERAIGSMMARVARDLGKLDLLVLSAAVFDRRRLKDLDTPTLDRTLAINLRAPIILAREALPLLRDGGHIVAISDVGARLAWPGFAHYCAAKAGLEAMVRCLAVELAPRVRVNAVAPGTVLWAERATAAERRRVAARIPLGRIGAPDDIARTVTFLATASDWITGQVFTVDGGRAVYSSGT